MVISSLVIAGIYGVYTIQQRSYTVQEQVTEMQQKMRSALDFMTSEIRLAGYSGVPYDSTGVCAGTAILTWAPDNFIFEFCNIDKNGTSYTATRMKSAYSIYDAYGDGTKDLGVQHGDSSSTKRAIAEGVDGIEFLYLKNDGTVATSSDQIRVVQISLLIRASYPDPKYVDSIKYIPASGTAWTTLLNGASNPANDHYHRQLLIASIKLRNAGL